MAFNTSPFHGKLARIEKNDVAVDFTGSYTFDVSVDMADVSRQGQQWKEGLPGQGSWGGSFDGHLVLGNTEQKALVDNIVTATPGTKLTDIKFLLDSATNAYTGNIYITNMGISAPSGDKVSVSFTFVGDGAPTVTASA